MSTFRWDVETPPGERFEDVVASALDVTGGCLVFRDDEDRVLIAYAAGTWKTVSLAEEAS